MSNVDEIEDFYGVYLLVSKSTNPKFAGRTYIGYTVDPNRRIKQHNRGEDAGGARRTSNRGPWTMVLIVHGFPNNISALRFEWAWQQPRISRRLKQIPELQKKLRKESNFEYNFRILSEMLRIGPWNRLPLVIRWFADEFHREFEAGKKPPLHMPICFGRMKKIKRKQQKTNVTGERAKAKQRVPNQAKSCKIAINYDFDEYDLLVMGGENIDDSPNHVIKEQTLPDTQDASVVISSDSECDDNGVNVEENGSQSTTTDCTICNRLMVLEEMEGQGDLVLRCLQPSCPLVCHPECLAASVLEPGQYVPVEGDCPVCEGHFLWGDIIRKANGCSDLVDDAENVGPLEVDDISDEEE
ncbi:structure-specific endonuclease subunit SLX1 homolog [Anopheles maculipalpis]|uniref:structure-specific endonuclease subunit SLX1 homolog n=1 Tax=Anopheles maculipalpis TaxID=1496333 RepID=UPI002158C03F|nr:structure-specific endonuclease subunit SLX1 homolog [Anopheles maculipalpis]